MKHQWGRSPEAGRQRSRWPIYTTLLLPLAVAAGIGTAVIRYEFSYTTLQRWYLWPYAMSSYGPRLVRAAIADTKVGLALTHGRYQLVDEVDERYVAQPEHTYDHATLEPWLRETVYNEQPVGTFVAWWSLVMAGGVFLFGLCLTIPMDAKRLRRIREGAMLRGGPRTRTVSEFNRAHADHDGLKIRVVRR